MPRPARISTSNQGNHLFSWNSLYYHAVVHWNLPAYPVDLEQRKGRVHRYKGHAVHKNVAAIFRQNIMPDPVRKLDHWDSLFELAKQHSNDASGIQPHWVYHGTSKILRFVPALPMSRVLQRLETLTKSLMVYRMVLGQNRQEDIVKVLQNRSDEELAKIVNQWQINLGPRDSRDS